ncbi:MAG: Smr/MutS family protein [FCB group bacterium]|nr:Smr/MutS family protein [FCB group bacterium]
MSGILVDQSATGSTAFIEPLETVEINNHLKRLELEEKREVERILKQITSMLFRRKAEVVDTLKIMAEIDCIFARAQYARDYNCCMPVISTENKIKIIQGRHPLLLMKQMNVVPLDLELGGEHVTMVISGPNAGGKTVALKTVGLLTLMAAAGCFVPAEKGTELPLVEEMHAVIGDEQSISADLSTFTGHVTKLTKVVKNSETRKLALIDEILSGTDPNEGTALAIAIMEKLTADRALTLVTTHKGDLKAYAHNAEGVINGSMEFDGETLSPTYRFRPGIPGSSYAFAISKKVGLSEELIERARQIQGEKKHELDSLIVELQTKLNEANKIAVKSEAERIKWETQRNLYTEKLKGIKSIEEKLKEKAMAEAERIMADANRTLELAVKAVREGGASKDAIKSAHEIIETGRERMSKRRRKKTISKEAVTEPIAVGDRVRIEESGVTGEILLVKDKERKFLILAGGLKIWMNREDLIKLKPQKEVKSQDIKIKHSISVATISPEIDIRGLDGAEAASKLEEYLAKISFENFDRVDIIHGKGKGVLKKVTTDILQENPSVKSFRHGRWGEGDDGVTIVELKKEK